MMQIEDLQEADLLLVLARADLDRLYGEATDQELEQVFESVGVRHSMSKWLVGQLQNWRKWSAKDKKMRAAENANNNQAGGYRFKNKDPKKEWKME